MRMATAPILAISQGVDKEGSMATKEAFRARVGDLVIVEGHKVGEARRVGEILEVLGEPGHEHYRVRWGDGRETVYYPSSDATIKPAERKKTGTKKAAR
jgi:hypothetical protein